MVNEIRGPRLSSPEHTSSMQETKESKIAPITVDEWHKFKQEARSGLIEKIAELKQTTGANLPDPMLRKIILDATEIVTRNINSGVCKKSTEKELNELCNQYNYCDDNEVNITCKDFLKKLIDCDNLWNLGTRLKNTHLNKIRIPFFGENYTDHMQDFRDEVNNIVTIGNTIYVPIDTDWGGNDCLINAIYGEDGSSPLRANNHRVHKPTKSGQKSCEELNLIC